MVERRKLRLLRTRVRPDGSGSSNNAKRIVRRLAIEAYLPFETSADVRIGTGTAKIRLPSEFVPMLSNAKEGWIDIDDLEINDREISGKLSVNFLNHPSFRIDRLNYEISVEGSGGRYRSTCEKADPEA